MPGCWLQVDLVLFFPVFSGSSTLAVPLDIPQSPGLIGTTFYNQAFMLDPLANSTGVSTSNAGEGRIGSR
jgi:hypothetical protein